MKEIAGARIVEHREVARATRWLVIELDEADPPEVWAPGHILALYVPNPASKWVRHPYTVSWAEGTRIGILYRVIVGGRTSPFMATLEPGEVLRIGGRFGAPIASLVPEDAPAVIGVSTGTGLGPLHGYAARALEEAPERPVTLLAGFREEADIALGSELTALAGRFPALTWHPTLSRPSPGWTGLVGRVGAHVASIAVEGAHWHLVGNGAMVTDIRAGLLARGVAQASITTEIYFNRGTSPDPVVAAAVAGGLPR